MNIFEKLLGRLFVKGAADISPAEAYDLWSLQYDDQPGNLMLALDEVIFNDLLANINLENKNIIDVGCGTGRHWNKILPQQPQSLIGYDVSPGMLGKLKEKFPAAITHELNGNHLPELKNESCDLVISTLTIAHISNLEEAFCEWARVLKIDGDIIITDYHPETLAHGGKRTFLHKGKTISVKNYIHTIEEIVRIAGKMKWELLRMEERNIDDSVKSYYQKKNALHVFEKFKGLPIIFGMHLKNKHVIM